MTRKYEPSNQSVIESIKHFRELLLDFDARIRALEKGNNIMVDHMRTMKETLRLIPRKRK